MCFDGFHPAILPVYFAAVIAGAAGFDHPCCIAAAYICAFVCSAALGGRRVLRFDLALLPLGACLALGCAECCHFGVTVLGVNFIGNRITLEAFVYGAALAARTAAVLMWLSCMYASLSSDKLVYLTGRAAPRLGLFLAAALRMLPRAVRHWRAAALSRRCVGLGAGQGRLSRRARNFAALCSITLTWTMEDLVESAAVMRSRGAALRGRTAYPLYRLAGRDRRMALILVALVTAEGMAALLGMTDALYDPVIAVRPVTATSAAFYALYVLLGLLPWLTDAAGKLRFRRRVARHFAK